MPEVDNCPVCNTTCELEYGLAEAVGVEIEKEILYATCKTCKTRWRRRDDPEVLGRMIYEKWACRIPEMTVSIPLVGSSIKLRSRWCRWIEGKERHIPVGTAVRLKPQEVPTRKGQTQEEKISVEKESIALYQFELRRGGRVRGQIISDKPVDVLFVDEKNFDKLDRKKRFEIEDGTENVYETKLDFKAPRKGRWFVVIGNLQKTSATVEVNLYSVHKEDGK